MLVSFRIKNFRSILDLSINFAYDEGKAPNYYKNLDHLIFLENSKKTHRVTPCTSIFGANASGKTNIIKAFDNFKKCLMYGVEYNNQKYYNPNKINDKYNTTLYEINFVKNNNHYKYCIEFNDSAFISEKLECNEKILYEINVHNRNFSNIETQTYTKEKLEEIFFAQCCNSEKMQKHAFALILFNYFESFNSKITSAFQFVFDDLCVVLHNTPDIKLPFNDSFKEIANMINKCDIDIVDMELKEFKIVTYHKNIKDENVEFALDEESAGTKILMFLINHCLTILKTGKVLIVDELDRSLHPFLLKQIIKMFKSKKYNKNNAQLIFSSHCTDILDDNLMRKSELMMVNKSANSGTSLKNVSADKKLRNVKDFRKMYVRGLLSGIPFPYI